jgi:hypothetical protein
VVLIRRFAGLLVAVVLTGCGTSNPSQPPAAGTPALPSTTASAAPGATSTAAQAVTGLNAGSIRTLGLPPGMQAHRLAADGPRLVFDEIGYGDETGKLGTHIYLADLETETMTTLASTANGDAAWVPDITSDAVAWSEWHRDDAGSIIWQVVVARLDTGVRTVVASGTNKRHEGSGAIPPLVQIDGDRVAYTVEDPTPERPWGWQVVVVSRSTGTVIEKYPTALSIYQMALSGDSVLYSEGLVDEQRSFKYATRLMLATPEAPGATQIAQDAFEVAFADGRLVWVSDPDSSEGQLGMAQHPQIATSKIDDARIQILSDRPGFKAAFWPTTADEAVAWSVDEGYSDGVGANRLALWDAVHGVGIVADAHTPAPLLGGRGWLLWYDDSAEGVNVVIHGAKLADMASP